MKTHQACLWMVVAFLVVTSPGCQCQVSTANIRDAKMAKDEEGNQATTMFAPTDTFHCVFTLVNSPDDTVVRSVWTAVEAVGAEPNYKIDEAEVTSGSGKGHFNLTKPTPWPVGKYKVDLYLNGKLDQTLNFTVEAPTGG